MSDALLWVGDPGARDAPEARRAVYDGPPKEFCPCDAGHPQDCKPEEWGLAHAPRPPCLRCGAQVYAHQGNHCRRPTPFAPDRSTDWIWYAVKQAALGEPPPWIGRAVALVNEALAMHGAITPRRKAAR